MMPPDRWGEELGAPRTWFALCDIRAGFEPLRARGIAAAFPMRRYRCHDRGFDMSFGEPSSPRRFAVSPTRRIAVSPFRRFASGSLFGRAGARPKNKKGRESGPFLQTD